MRNDAVYLALNSAWEIDEHFPRRASINEQALAHGLLAAEDQLRRAREAGNIPAQASILRIAVWHHAVSGNNKIQDVGFLEKLRQCGFQLCVHGDVHENRPSVAGYPESQRLLHIAGVGSFAAEAAARPESVPRQYNLIEISRDHREIRIHHQYQPTRTSAWDAWAVYPGPDPNTKRTYYEITLGRQAAVAS